MCVEEMLNTLIAFVCGSVGESSLELLSSNIGAMSMQSATHLLAAVERLGGAHDAIGGRVVELLLRVGLVLPASAPIVHRTARQLLASLCENRPLLVSRVLLLVGPPASLWSALLFLARHLPLSKWLPSQTDLEIIKVALREVCCKEKAGVFPVGGIQCVLISFHFKAPDSDANKAARLLVDGLNLGWNQDEEPALGPELHRSLALMAVETLLWHEQRSASAGGTGWRLPLVGGGGQVNTAESELSSWTWRLFERTLHRDAQGRPFLAPLPLSQVAGLSEVLSGSALLSEAGALAAWVGVSAAGAGPADVGRLLGRLASVPHAESAFWRALADAAFVLVSEPDAALTPISELVRAVLSRGTSFFDQSVRKTKDFLPLRFGLRRFCTVASIACWIVEASIRGL